MSARFQVENNAARGALESNMTELKESLVQQGIKVEELTVFIGQGLSLIHILFTVLVDGDDLMDPIADAARSVLDGHIVLARRLASLNHYPAIDILQLSLIHI